MITLLHDDNKEAHGIRKTQEQTIASQQKRLDDLQNQVDTLQKQVEISREESRSGVSEDSKAEMNDLVGRIAQLENIVQTLMDANMSRSASGTGSVLAEDSAAGEESDRVPQAAVPKPVGVLKAPPYEQIPAPALPPPVPKAKAKASDDVAAPEPKRPKSEGVVFKPIPGTSPPRNPPRGAKNLERSDQDIGHQRMPVGFKIDMTWRTKRFSETFTPRSDHSAYHLHDQRIMAGFTPVCYPDQCPRGWRERADWPERNYNAINAVRTLHPYEKLEKIRKSWDNFIAISKQIGPPPPGMDVWIAGDNWACAVKYQRWGFEYAHFCIPEHCSNIGDYRHKQNDEYHGYDPTIDMELKATLKQWRAETGAGKPENLKDEYWLRNSLIYILRNNRNWEEEDYVRTQSEASASGSVPHEEPHDTMMVTTLQRTSYAGTSTAPQTGLPSPVGPPEAFAPGSLFSSASASASMQTEVSRKKKKSDEDQEADSLEKEEVGKLRKEIMNLEIIISNAKELIINSTRKVEKMNKRITEITGVKTQSLLESVSLGTADLTAKQELRRQQMVGINEQVLGNKGEKKPLVREQSFQYSFEQGITGYEQPAEHARGRRQESAAAGLESARSNVYPTAIGTPFSSIEADVAKARKQTEILHGQLTQRLSKAPSPAAAAAVVEPSKHESLANKKMIEAYQRKYLYVANTQHGRLKVDGRKVKWSTDSDQMQRQMACFHPFSSLSWAGNGTSVWAECRDCGARCVLGCSKQSLPIPSNEQLAAYSAQTFTVQSAVDTAEAPGSTTSLGKLPKQIKQVLLSQRSGRILPDSGCKLTVAGRAWHQDNQAWYDNIKIKYKLLECDEQFRFGSGNVVRATQACCYPICLNATDWHVLWVAIVDVPCPGLLSAGAMAEVGLVMDFKANKMYIQGTEIPLFDITGHPDMALIHPKTNLKQRPRFFEKEPGSTQLIAQTSTSSASTDRQFNVQAAESATQPPDVQTETHSDPSSENERGRESDDSVSSTESATVMFPLPRGHLARMREFANLPPNPLLKWRPSE